MISQLAIQPDGIRYDFDSKTTVTCLKVFNGKPIPLAMVHVAGADRGTYRFKITPAVYYIAGNRCIKPQLKVKWDFLQRPVPATAIQLPRTAPPTTHANTLIILKKKKSMALKWLGSLTMFETAR